MTAPCLCVIAVSGGAPILFSLDGGGADAIKIGFRKLLTPIDVQKIGIFCFRMAIV